ncbi:MAG: Ig-like domain-containing protein [Anaerolineae bacterium]
MLKNIKSYSFLIVILAMLGIVACGGVDSVEPEQPTEEAPEPTEVLPTWTPAPTQEPVPTAVPTDVPTLEPAALDQTFDWEPQPILFSPSPGEETLLDGAITIRFDQPMDEASVEGAFAIEPAVDGQFSWPRPDLVIFTPDGQLEREQQYQVQLADSAKGLNGKQMREAVKFQVQTVGTLKISSIIPADGTQDVPTDGAITVLFNRPVVPLVATQDQASLPVPIQLNPPTPGNGEWISTSIFRFVPEAGFAGATDYSITIPGGLVDVTGGELVEGGVSSFSTIAPRVESLFPYESFAGWPLERELEITFNMPMDPTRTQEAISLNPATPLTFEWVNGNRQVRITPNRNLEIATNYQLVVEKDAAPASGQGGLDQRYEIPFSTVPLPAVIRTEPASGQVDYPAYGYVSFEFSAPMDWETIDGQITIDPEPKRTQLNYGEGSNWLGINFAMSPSTDYTITIPGSAADPYGNTLGEDYVLEFTTAEADPFVRIAIPFSVNVFSSSYAPQIDVRYLNVKELNLQLNRVDGALDQLFYASWWENQPQGELVREWIRPVEDVQNENGLVRLDLNSGDPLPTGVYHLLVDAPDLPYAEAGRFAENRMLLIVDTNLVTKETVEGVYVWATDMQSGEPVSGQTITLYNYEGDEVSSAVTGADGVAFFADALPQNQYMEGFLAVTGSAGEPGFGIAGSQWSQTIGPWEFGLNIDFSREQALKSYVYTDRPLYRPGDVVQFRGVLRTQDYGRYTIPAEQSVTIALNEQAYYGESEPYSDEIKVLTQPNGLFFGEFTIPEGANPGNYSLSSSQNSEWFGQTSIQVAEFRKPEFEVKIDAPESDLLRGEAGTVTVQADYFFGGSASDLEVNYTVFDQTFNYSYPEPYRFSTQDYYFWQPFEPVSNIPIFSGSGVTDSDGKLVIELPADMLKDAEAGSRNITVEAVVFDVNYQPFAARTNLTLHAAEVYVGIQSNEYIVESGDPAGFSILTVDWDGEAVGNVSAEAALYRQEWERNDFGWYEPVDILIEETEVELTTDNEGRSNLEYIINDGGNYKVIVTATDSGGRTHQSSTLVWVTGDNARWRVQPETKTMQLIPDKAEYAVGETARILVQSPFEGPQQAWLTIERGKLLEQRIVTIDGTGDTLEIPIELDHLPNVHVSLTAIKPEGTSATDVSRYADMRFGVINLPVKVDPFLLNVELVPRLPESGLYGPGETAIFDVQITNQNGQPLQGTLSVALVDKAIFALASDNTQPIDEAFYGPQYLRSQTGASLAYSAEGYEAPDEEVLGGRGGGGESVEESAAAPEAFAAEADLADDGANLNQRQSAVVAKDAGATDGIDVRSDFRDTAYWEAEITTDANGQATVEIPLPDNLTTWRLHAKTVTGETLVNQTGADITVQKPILVRPITPRFFTVGDVAEIGTVVNNNTDSDVEVNVQIDVTGATAEGELTGTLTVPANGSVVFRVPVRVDNRETDFVDFTFTVWNEDFNDASKPSFGVGPEQLIPVYRYNAEDIVATSGVLAGDDTRRVEAVLLPEQVDTDSGDIRFKLNGSLAAVVFEGLEAVEREPYDRACAHSVASRLMPNATIDRAINQLNLDEPELADQLAQLIPADIQALADSQKADGGWGWCYSERTSPWFTAYVLLALDRATDAGYDVNQRVRVNGIDYLESHLQNPSRLSGNGWEANAQAFYLYVIAELGNGDSDAMAELYAENKENLDSYAKALLVTGLSKDKGDQSVIDTILSDLNSTAFVSATGAHWEDDDYQNLSSDVRATAMAIMAFSNADPDAPFGPQAVNWLMGARKAQVWRSTHDTAWVLTALTDWLVQTGELDGDYTYSVLLNGDAQVDGAFSRDNMIETTEAQISVGQMNPTEVNFFEFSKDGDGRLYYNAWLDTFVPADLVGPIDRGLSIERQYFDATCDSSDPDVECEEITQIAAGQQVRVELTVIAKRDLVYAVIEDYFPAGAEAVDPNLGNASQFAEQGINRTSADSYWWWGWWSFDKISYRDERITFTSNYLPSGTYRYTYTLNAILPGEYQVRPTFGYEEFTPEVNGRAAGKVFTVIEE